MDGNFLVRVQQRLQHWQQRLHGIACQRLRRCVYPDGQRRKQPLAVRIGRLRAEAIRSMPFLTGRSWTRATAGRIVYAAWHDVSASVAIPHEWHGSLGNQ